MCVRIDYYLIIFVSFMLLCTLSICSDSKRALLKEVYVLGDFNDLSRLSIGLLKLPCCDNIATITKSFLSVKIAATKLEQ